MNLRIPSRWAPYVLVSPFLILFAVFGLFPLLFSLWLAFQSWEPTSGLDSMTFVGLDNFVFALTGYHPDVEFLQSAGIRVDPATLRPEHDPETLETNRSGVYVAGGMVSGRETNKIFIENGRFHGEQIMNAPGFDLARRG